MGTWLIESWDLGAPRLPYHVYVPVCASVVGLEFVPRSYLGQFYVFL